MLWNYGYEMNLLRDSIGSLGESLAFIFRKNKSALNFLIKLFSGTTYNLEIAYTKAQGKEVDWVSEAVLCVRSKPRPHHDSLANLTPLEYAHQNFFQVLSIGKTVSVCLEL
ncbi:MAG: hypothetical protein Q7R43_05835 [Candidatus Daviesbacteria bacterium]|nr:hypothetical protein [Candidatus Daviesbacteria bacterium]